MKISVALCTYNGEIYLKEQVDSILNQTMKVNEIIVCDDGSTDATLTILNEYAAANPNLFHIHKNEINLRSVKNFEKAVTLCTGDLIFLSDQDDKWALNKVEDYVAYFKENPTVQVLASNGYCIDSQSKLLDKYTLWDIPEFFREENIPFDYHTVITCVSNIVTGASIALKKEIIPEIVPFPSIKNFHHDEWIAIIATKKKAFAMVNEKYFYYRMHENQQVGGVFFAKTPKERTKLMDNFNMEEKNLTLVKYKKKLRKLSDTYSKTYFKSQFFKNNFPQLQYIFEDTLTTVEMLFESTKKEMKKKYPLAATFLSVSDKLFNKRQLKKRT